MERTDVLSKLRHPSTGLAPLIACVVATVGIVTTPSGDIREGLFPWGTATAFGLLAMTALAVLANHPTPTSRTLIVGAWWTALALAGIAAFFAAVGIGGLLGIDEETDNPAALIPIAAMTFGLLSTMPATATLAVGVQREGRFPRWSLVGLWSIVPVLPGVLILGGLTEGTVETVGSLLLFAAFAIGWAMLGMGLRAANRTATTLAADGRPGLALPR